MRPIMDTYDLKAVKSNIDIINKIRAREDKVLKKPELVKLSVENFRQKQSYSTS